MRSLRLTAHDFECARNLFVMMAQVFGEESAPLSDEYLNRLLSRADFWAIAAIVGDELVGGITAYTLPLTRTEAAELFVYDIAVRADHQRTGVGRLLVSALREGAAAEGIREMIVPAENVDQHALDFYRALGGVPSAVTFFTFSAAE